MGCSLIVKGKGEGKRLPSLSRYQAYTTSSSSVSGRRMSDSVRSNEDCHITVVV